MTNEDVKSLVEAFKAYRTLIDPIQASLSDFIDTYNSMKDDIARLNIAFDGDVQKNLSQIYDTLSSQAEKATDLSSRIDKFSKTTEKYTAEVNKMISTFEGVEKRIASVNEIEKRAEEQIGRLDALLEEKKKTYNVKDLQRTLEQYNSNVQKVSEFINKDVAKTISDNNAVLGDIRQGQDNIERSLAEEDLNVQKLLEEFTQTNALLRKITEKEDVNEAYIFDILDKWANVRGVKIKNK